VRLSGCGLPMAPPLLWGRSRTTAVRSDLAGYAGYGDDTSHHCFYWGSRLLLVTTCEGTVTSFGLANPKLYGERKHPPAAAFDPVGQPATQGIGGGHRQGPERSPIVYDH
jgi:hypothetical protein